MRLRSVSRSDRLTVAAGDASNNRTGAGSGWIEAARARRAEAVRRANLEQDLAIANRYLGVGSTSEEQNSPTVPEPNAPERIRTLGRPISLMGVLPGVDVPPAKLSLAAESGLWAANANRPASRMIIALVVAHGGRAVDDGLCAGSANGYAGAVPGAGSGLLTGRSARSWRSR